MKSAKIALVDMDYTICNFQEPMELYLRSLESPEEIGKYDYSNLWKLEGEHPHIGKRIRTILSKHSFWANLKPIEAGLELYKYIANHFETYILTKALKECSLAWREKVDWLHRYIGKDIEIMVVTNKKLVHGDLLFDDMPENAEDFLRLNPNGRVIMPRREHNKHINTKENVYVWNDSLKKDLSFSVSYDFSGPHKIIQEVLND